MARETQLRATVTAKDDASKTLDKIADKAADLEKPVEVEVESNVSAVLRSLDEVASEAKRTKEVADQLATALGPELAAKADTTRIVGELRKLGLEFDEIEGDVDQLGSKLKELSDADVGGNLGASLGTARGQIDDLGRSADSSKSVMANMVGNTTQDLGELGGIAGSTGVAIGQMGEYMADALHDGDKLTNVLRNFALVAGPIALVGAAVQVVTGLLAEQAAKAQASEARTKAFGEAMSDTADDALGLSDALKDNIDELRNFDAEGIGFGDRVRDGLGKVGKQLPLVGGLIGDAGQNVHDLTGLLDKAGLSFYDLSRAIEDGAVVNREWVNQLRDAVAQGKLTEDEAEALSNAWSDYAQNVDAAKQVAQLFNVEQKDANAILQELLGKQAPLEQMTDTWKTLFDDMRDGTIDTEAAADAINLLADALGLTQDEVIALAQQQLDEEMKDAEDAIDDVTESVHRASSSFEGLQRRYRDFLGLIDRRESYRNLEDAITNLDEKAKDAWIAQKTGAEDAEEKMREYEDSIWDMIDAMVQAGAPPDIIAKVVADLDEGKLNEARWTAQTWLNNHAATLPVKPTLITNNLGTRVRVDENGNVVSVNATTATRAADIARQIGVVSIPAEVVVQSTKRLTGARE